MLEFTRRLMESTFGMAKRTSVFDDGLINIGEPGHTKDSALVKEAHEGRATAAYYMAGTALGLLDESEGIKLLEAIQGLQITDRESPYYGNFFWYREEKNFHDSNAAFFILTPLIIMRLKMEANIPKAHISLMDQMMEKGTEWFESELDDPILYYPNKILSDGALLLALSRISGQKEHYQKGIEFFEKWLAYTEKRGWGWGENLSLSYIRIIVNALQITISAMNDEDAPLKQKLQNIMDGLFEYIRFHGDFDFVPTIRSYNFTGTAKTDSVLLWAAGVRTDLSELQHSTIELSQAMTVWLCEERIASAQSVSQNVPRVRQERVFDQSQAYTWIGQTGRLGSLNRFPVIPGSYQWPRWGLAWQSFPVSFLIEDHPIGFLRWFVHDGQKVRTHPAYEKTRSLDPGLFHESWYPNVQMRTAQKDNALLIYRSMSGVHNLAQEIADEWMIQRFEGTTSMCQDSEGRTWAVLHYPNAQVLITSCKGIAEARTDRSDIELGMDWVSGDGQANTLRIRQVLYEGRLQEVQHPRLETTWVVWILDQEAAPEEAKQWLQDVSIVDDMYRDGEVPREIAYLENRRIQVMKNGVELITLHVDPHEVG